MKLERITVPMLPEPPTGPWRRQLTKPNGETELSACNYSCRETAEADAALHNQLCVYGSIEVVIIDPGGARFMVWS